jgi:hypothetical protein
MLLRDVTRAGLVLGLMVWQSAPLVAAASLYGIPQPPTPAPLPAAWFAAQNDVFGDAILNTDDFRTGGVHAGISSHGFVLAIDDSAFTSRGADGLPRGRTDELKGTLGYALIQDESPTAALSTLVIAGGGAKSVGDYSGQRVQNDIHHAFGFKPVYLPYDSQRHTAGIGYMYARALWLPWRDNAKPLPLTIGFQVESAIVATTRNEQEDFGAFNLVAMGSQGVGWIGLQYQHEGGSPESQTAGIVARHESGYWVSAGLGRQTGLYVSGAIDPSTRAIDGNLGFVCQTDSLDPDPNKLPVSETFVFFPEGGSIGAQVQWQPFENRDQGPLHHNLLVDYHFGSVPHYSWANNRVDADQFLFGYEPEYVHAIPGIPWLMSEAFVYSAGGLRIERVRVLDQPSRFSQHTATRPVLQGGGGIRFGVNIHDDPRLFINQVRLGFGWDGWIPLRRETVRSSTESEVFQKPGNSPIISIGFNVIW